MPFYTDKGAIEQGNLVAITGVAGPEPDEAPDRWFVRVERGLYTLSEPGRAALVRWKAHLPASAAEPTPVSAALAPP
jgi:hypothetical protein